MKIKAVPFSWIRRWGLRLDTSPYMGGAVEARVTLDKIRFKKEPLKTLTSGHNGGIFNGPMFRRNYVESAEFGVPFLTSGSMLKAELSDLSFLRRKDAESNKLSFLQLVAGTTMISCSGTIGRMVYARPDMVSMWASQDILKVVPDKSRIPSGYLHAFLTGKFGVPLITSGTYGAIIQHIEAEHIADLPVPRLGDSVEQKAHEWVEKAAKLRAEASTILAQGIEQLLIESSLPHMPLTNSPYPFSVRSVSSKKLSARFDAFFHSRHHNEAINGIKSCSSGFTTVAEMSSSVVEPTRFKRAKIDDERYGIPFFGTSALFWSDPVPIYMIAKALPGLEQYIVHRKTLLVPRSGQLSGIIGRVVLPYGAVVGGAVSEDAIRINCPDENTAGYLFLALASGYGVRQLKARAYGSSIPHLDVNNIRSVLVPDLKPASKTALGKIGLRTALLRDEAIKLEKQARDLVASTIQEAV